MALSGRIACLECDLVLPMPELGEGQRANCPRCGHTLTSRPLDGFQRSLAFTLAASVFLMAACMFPFLSMKAGGFENAITLFESTLEIYENGQPVVAVIVGAFILVIPAAVLLGMLALLVPLFQGRNAPWLVASGRLVFGLSPWSMVEVFVIGVIVSLVKLASMATMVLGISFWSYVAFSICMTAAVSSLDRMYVWDSIERVSTR